MSADKLPYGWARVKLGEAITRTSQRCTPEVSPSVRWIGADHLDEGDLSVCRWSTTDDPMFPPTFRFSVPSGSVLLHSRNPKKVAILPFDAITGEKLFCLAPVDGSALDSRFLAYQLQSDNFHEFVGRWLSGSVNKFLNWTALARYEFVLPPIDEQRRTVEVLSLINDVCRRSATVAKRAEVAVSSFVAQFDSSAETVKLSSLLSLLTKGTTPTSIGAGFARAGVRFLKAENVIDGRIDYKVESFVDSATDALLARSRLKERDVLLTIAGTIGRSAVVDDIDLPANCNQAVAILRPSPKVNPWFLSAWLGGADARRQIEQRRVSNTISNLSLGVIGDLDFPVLSKDAQDAAVSGILAARSVARVAREHRESVIRMLEAVRSDLLSGGPASVQ